MSYAALAALKRDFHIFVSGSVDSIASVSFCCVIPASQSSCLWLYPRYLTSFNFIDPLCQMLRSIMQAGARKGPSWAATIEHNGTGNKSHPPEDPSFESALPTDD